MIQAIDISYHIHQKILLNKININIKLGKVTAILGPNGAGKSTLLKCLTGTLSPTNGSITLNGKNLHDHSFIELAKKRAVLLQSSPINFPFTAQEIVMMGRNPYYRDNENPKIIQKAMESLDVWHLKDRIFPTLSGGEQQRIQMARILAQLWNQKNAYLFLDEPTSALDLKHQHHLLNLINSLAKTNTLGICIILHDLGLAAHYADQVCLMKNGNIKKMGDIEDVMTAKNIATIFDIPEDLVCKNIKLR